MPPIEDLCSETGNGNEFNIYLSSFNQLTVEKVGNIFNKNEMWYGNELNS